jgi:hypothetical protein
MVRVMPTGTRTSSSTETSPDQTVSEVNTALIADEGSKSAIRTKRIDSNFFMQGYVVEYNE